MTSAPTLHLATAGWHRRGGTHVRGTAFLGDQRLPAEALCARFEAAAGDTDRFTALITPLNGFFSVVHTHGTRVLAAVDIVRSIPLFHARGDSSLFLSDDARWVRDRVGDRERDPEAEAEFRLLGYVSGADTVHKAVKQLRAGTLLAYDGNTGAPPTTHRYFRHLPTGKALGSRKRLCAELDEVMAAVASRVVAYADGSTIAIPLSAGFDSRAIALALARTGYDKLMAFSFGVPGNHESKISREVAEALNVPWHFVEYDNERWSRWFRSAETAAYCRTADHLSVLPVLQDLPALQALKDRGVLPEGSVLCPGYAADLNTGVFSVSRPTLYLRRQLDKDVVARAIVDTYWSLWAPTAEERALALRKVRLMLDDVPPGTPPFAAYEEWFTLEKVAKYIVNAVRIYEFRGMRWWLPLFDRQFVDFWLKVPLAERLWQRLYAYYLEGLSHEVAGVSWPSRKNDRSARVRGAILDVLRDTRLASWHSTRRLRQRQRAGDSEYNGHRLGLWGRVPYELFSEKFTGRENVNSFWSEQYPWDEVST